MKWRGSTEHFHRFTFRAWLIGLFLVMGGYLLYNAIIVRENKQKLTLFSFSARKSSIRHLVYFDSSRSNHSKYNLLRNRRYDNAFLNSTFLVLLFLYVTLHMCFILLDQINVIFMRSLYEAVIWCDCIIKRQITSTEVWRFMVNIQNYKCWRQRFSLVKTC